jgi:acyl-coenzyme A thioesterase PaaI-like protein
MTAETGPVRAEARVITFGRKVALREGWITDASGRSYASATSTWLVFERN